MRILTKLDKSLDRIREGAFLPEDVKFVLKCIENDECRIKDLRDAAIEGVKVAIKLMKGEKEIVADLKKCLNDLEAGKSAQIYEVFIPAAK
jgi:hypothetical protein